MSWFILFIAGCFEIGWAVRLKYTEGFSKPGPTIATLIAMVISLSLLGVALRTLPVGTAYSVWVGIGTVVLGVLLFGEPASFARLVFVLLIIVGIVGLKITSPT